MTWTEVLAVTVSVLGAIGSLIGWCLARRDAKKAAIERKAEAQEAAQRIGELVAAAREQADRAARLATAAEAQASSAARSAAGVESIAETLSPARFTVQWRSHRTFVLRNMSPAPVTIESFINQEQFVKPPFEIPASIGGMGSVQGLAVDVWGRSFPGELVLDLVGEDGPVVVPLDGRPAKD